MKTYKYTHVALAAALLAFATVSHGQSFTNGSFEGDLTAYPNYSADSGIVQNQVPSGWSLFNDPITETMPYTSPDWINSVAIPGGATEGDNWLVIDGLYLPEFAYIQGVSYEPGYYHTGISQAVADFDLSQEYQFSIDLARLATSWGSNSNQGVLDLYFNGNVVHTFEIPNALIMSYDGGYIVDGDLLTQTFNFTPSTEAVDFALRARYTGPVPGSGEAADFVSIAMDNLRLSPVPEPSGTLLIGLTSILTLLRRGRAV